MRRDIVPWPISRVMDLPPNAKLSEMQQIGWIFPPKHDHWPSICDAKAPMTAFGQYALVPAFYANRASVAQGAHIVRTACEASSLYWD